MARKMVLRVEGGEEPALTEVDADSEAQLQTFMRDHPEVLPLDDFGLSGPMLVVGRETQLASGAVDLVGIARGGELLVVEFKTGPQNSDFRSALAQLLDYGSDIWRMTYEQFERAIALRYFSSDHCTDSRFHGLTSLEAAARAAWDDLGDGEWATSVDRLSNQLATGKLNYVLGAQRFTETSLTTMDYLNHVSAGPRFFAVEMVRFAGEHIEAFECRTVLKPASRNPGGSATQIDREKFLAAVADDSYRSDLEGFLGSIEALGLRFEWGSVGVSIRLSTPWRSEPVTLGWAFPPGRSGWSGLRDITLGYDPGTLDRVESALPVFKRYVERVLAIHGVEPLKGAIQGVRVTPECLHNARAEILAAIESLKGEVENG